MRALVLAILIIALSGCRTRRTVVTHKGPRGTVRVVKVTRGPPAPPRVLVVKPRRPGAKHIWVKGHYVYASGRYTWRKARWVIPPRGMRAWVPGHYRRREWVPGHWR